MTVNDRNRFRKTYSSFRSEPRIQETGAGGDVFGPNGAVANNLVIFSGSSGKDIRDSGISAASVAAIVSIGSLTGDVTGSLSDTAVVKLQGRSLTPGAPAIYQHIASPDGTTWTPTYATQPCGSVELTFATSSADVDGIAFTVPATPTGDSRFLLTMVLLRLSQTVTGSASVGLRVGTSVGGLQVVTPQTIDSGSSLGSIVGGLSLTSLGLLMSSSLGYTTPLSSSATVNFRASTTGSLTGGKATCYVYGAFLP